MTDEPLENLREAIHRMRSGNFPVTIDAGGDKNVARLARSLSGLSRSLQRGKNEADLLMKIAERISADVSLSDVLDDVYESFRSLIPYDRIGVAMLEENGRAVQAAWARTDLPSLQLDTGFRQALADTSLGDAIAQNKPRIINDLVEYLRRHPKSEGTQLLVKEGIRSSLTCPLTVAGVPTGFVFFNSREFAAYAHAHVDSFLRISGLLAIALEKSRLYERVISERERADRLLFDVFPWHIAERLKHGETRIAERFPDTTVIFVDLVGFTSWSHSLDAGALVDLLNEIFAAFDDVARRNGVAKIKNLGDGAMFASGVPVVRPDHADAAAETALDLLETVRGFKTPAGEQMEARIGIHTGPVAAGVIGSGNYQYDLWGETVNIASRMESLGIQGQIQVSEESWIRLQRSYICEERGMLELKGSGLTRTWLLKGRRALPARRRARWASVDESGERRSALLEASSQLDSDGPLLAEADADAETRARAKVDTNSTGSPSSSKES